MSNYKAIAEGLGLILRETHSLPATVGDLAAQVGVGASYNVHHLRGVTCPFCKASGTLAKMALNQLHDVGIDPLGSSEMDMRETLFVFEKLGFHGHEFNPLGPDGEATEVVIVNQEAVAAQKTPWLCFSCFESVDPALFVKQLLRKRPRLL